MKAVLTTRQEEVYKAIQDYAAIGRSPSLEELAIRVNMASTSTLRRHLNILTTKGLLRPRRYKVPRDIFLAEPLRSAA